MTEQELLERIVTNPEIMVGKPVIKGTRVPVELVVRMMAQGINNAEILQEYPRLEVADLRAALYYAANIVAHEDVYPLIA